MQIKQFLWSVFKWTDRWRCQCLMIQDLALWIDKYPILQKSLQVIATSISFLSLILSGLSLGQPDEIKFYRPAYGNFLVSTGQHIESLEILKTKCHFFNDLSLVKYVGFDVFTFFQIRIVILFILFVLDMFGLLFSYIYPRCGTKTYILGLSVTLLFFVMFPSELCINFGTSCIQHSPIFQIYRIQFMIQFNVAWLGIGAIGIIVTIYPLAYFTSEYCNVCGAPQTCFDIIYGILCIPFFVIALINFVTSMWTSSALINVLTLMGTLVNYLLYHAGTDVGKQIAEKQRQIERLLYSPFTKINPQSLYEYNFQEEFGHYDTGNQRYREVQRSARQKERLNFYRQWQNRLYRQFHQP